MEKERQIQDNTWREGNMRLDGLIFYLAFGLYIKSSGKILNIKFVFFKNFLLSPSIHLKKWAYNKNIAPWIFTNWIHLCDHHPDEETALSPSQKFPLIFPSSQSCPPPTKETSHLTSYCLDCISMHCMLIWVKEARHTMIMCFVRIIECSCWSPSWLYTNVPSYECTTRFFWNCYIYLCQIERCGVRKPHGNSGREWGLSKCTDSEDEEKWAYLERDLGVKIYRTWDQLIGWGDEEYRQHG